MDDGEFPGVNYEKDFSEVADKKPPRCSIRPWGLYLIFSLKKKQNEETNTLKKGVKLCW